MFGIDLGQIKNSSVFGSLYHIDTKFFPLITIRRLPLEEKHNLEYHQTSQFNQKERATCHVARKANLKPW